LERRGVEKKEVKKSQFLKMLRVAVGGTQLLGKN